MRFKKEVNKTVLYSCVKVIMYCTMYAKKVSRYPTERAETIDSENVAYI